MKRLATDRWVRLLVAVLAIVSFAIFTFGSLQYQKYTRLNTQAQTDAGSLLWIVYQLEREHTRWHSALELVAKEPSDTHWEQAKLRFEILVSRVDLLRASPIAESLRTQPEYGAADQQMLSYMRDGEALVALNSVSTAQLLPWLTRAQELDDVLRQLTNRANLLVYDYIEETNQTLQSQGRWLLGMLGTQLLILLVSLAALARLIAAQRRQNKALRLAGLQYEEARAQAQAANSAKDRFLANMSHELRTPFQGVLGMLELLGTTGQTPEQRDYTRTAHDSAQHLLGILGDMLDVATIDAGTLQLENRAVHLPSLAHEIHALMQPAARAKALQLHLEIAPDLPAWVMLDAKRLRQILYNLVGNAIKFTQQGRVDIRLAAFAPAGDGGGATGLRLVVTDTGIGMDVQAQEKVFSRFYQADDSIRRRFGGTGLGLEISRYLARAMGGDISVQSAPGQGACFMVDFPLLASAGAQPALATLSDPAHGLAGAPALNVLAAEDYPVNQKFLRAMLAHLGHRVQVCDDGQQVLEAVQTQTFDVVLMDLQMPVLDGLEATRIIRAMPGAVAQTPIIMISADVLPETQKRAHEAGVNAFLAKPVQMQALQSQLLRCVAALGGATEDGMAHEGGVPEPTRPTQALPVPGAGPAQAAFDPLAQGAAINPAVLQEFISLVPPSTVEKFKHDLFDPQQGELRQLQDALAANAHARVLELAHPVKGACHMLGLCVLGNLLAQVESAARQGQAMPPYAVELASATELSSGALALALATSAHNPRSDAFAAYA